MVLNCISLIRNDFESPLKDLLDYPFKSMSLARGRVRGNGRSGLRWFVILHIF